MEKSSHILPPAYRQSLIALKRFRGNRRVLLPEALRQALDLRVGDSVALYTEDERIIVEPLKEQTSVVLVKQRVRINIPVAIRTHLQLQPDSRYVIRSERNKIIVMPAAEGVRANNWMLPLPAEICKRTELSVGDALEIAATEQQIVLHKLPQSIHQLKLDAEGAVAIPRAVQKQLALQIGDQLQLLVDKQRIVIGPVTIGDK